ncbi:MAG: Hsp33 family molecular chaperone HslO [Spirochaetales bacterium]|nr:Hsp33 family molecular chaperone HslO [Spirochaetales bacterium]
MIKKKIYGDTVRERLLAGRRDKMHRFTLADRRVRGVILHGTKLVSEMRANHELGILETLILGYGYLGALLLSSSLKGAERLVLEIVCDGPLRGLSVEASAFGEVRGYLREKHLPVTAPLESFDLTPFWGKGILSVTRHLEEAKTPFTGRVELSSGSLALNLAHYSLQSEQTPSSYSLSVRFDKHGGLVGAGGLLVQALPGADDALLAGLEAKVNALPRLGQEFADKVTPEAFVLSYFGEYDPEFTGDKRVDFMCHCRPERFLASLNVLAPEELADLVANGPYPLVLTCANCNTAYEYTREEVERAHGSQRPKNL